MTTAPDLATYDIILVNSSAGKDSQAMLDVVIELATAAGVRDRVQVVHADLGRVEWAGTRDLAEVQAKTYGVPFHVVSRPQGDLLTQIEGRGMWPSSTARYCTSDHKRDQVAKVVVSLTKGRPGARVLNCIGIRAEESPARSKKNPFQNDKRASTSKRTVDTWFPIFDWTVDQVWARIRQSGVPHHRAYDLGMDRLSCVFCVFAPKAALMIAGRHNGDLLDQYVAVEQKIGHTFRQGFTIASVRDAIRTGQPLVLAGDDDTKECWRM